MSADRGEYINPQDIRYESGPLGIAFFCAFCKIKLPGITLVEAVISFFNPQLHPDQCGSVNSDVYRGGRPNSGHVSVDHKYFRSGG